MPQYLTPGVYVEEVPSGSAPIAGASTSTPGIVGYVAGDVVMPFIPGKFVQAVGADGTTPLTDDKGNPVMTGVRYTLADAGKPYLITSWEQYKNTFGDFQTETPLPKNLSDAQKTAFFTDAANLARPSRNGTLAHAVFGFFNNGGSRCWVVRTDAPVADALPTDPTQHSLAPKGVVPATPPTPVAIPSAAARGTAVQAALDALKPIDEIALIVVPGATDTAVKKAIYQHCEGLGDRFAILDGLPDPVSGATVENTAGADLGTTNYAAVYFPWIQVSDPATANDPVTKGQLLLPPSGHIAGVYARVDATRGVHKAPAAEVIYGATNLAQRLAKSDQDGLNPHGVNIIRNFDGNIKIWGARTLGGDDNGEWKYINVRRTFLYLRKSIDNGTQWAVF